MSPGLPVVVSRGTSRGSTGSPAGEQLPRRQPRTRPDNPPARRMILRNPGRFTSVHFCTQWASRGRPGAAGKAGHPGRATAPISSTTSTRHRPIPSTPGDACTALLPPLRLTPGTRPPPCWPTARCTQPPCRQRLSTPNLDTATGSARRVRPTRSFSAVRRIHQPAVVRGCQAEPSPSLADIRDGAHTPCQSVAWVLGCPLRHLRITGSRANGCGRQGRSSARAHHLPLPARLSRNALLKRFFHSDRRVRTRRFELAGPPPAAPERAGGP